MPTSAALSILVHRRDAFRGEKALADRVRQKENIKIQYDSAVSKIRGESAVSSVLLENTKTGAQQELPVSAVFFAIGLIPENEIFSRQLPLDDNGYFVAGEDCKTPLEGVFVAGNCRSKLLRQIITAAADRSSGGLSGGGLCQRDINHFLLFYFPMHQIACRGSARRAFFHHKKPRQLWPVVAWPPQILYNGKSLEKRMDDGRKRPSPAHPPCEPRGIEQIFHRTGQ